MPRLLLVEGDAFLQRTLQTLFAAEEYFCAVAADGKEALAALQGDPFDLVILHLGELPAETLEVLRELRLAHHTPVLALAPHGDVIDTVAGLEYGADDYLCEPFDPRELVARVRAQLRRADEYSRPIAEGRRIDFGTFTLDLDRRDALRGEVPLHLTGREFELLYLLARHPGKALATGWIFENLWGYPAELGTKALAVSIGRLRRKLEVDAGNPRLLINVRGYGYKLVASRDEGGT